MGSELKHRIRLLFVAGALVAAAVLIRVWLASTGSYSSGGASVPLRVVSAVTLAVGFLMAAAVVAWPMRKVGEPDGD
jgi:hypothetical protein